MNTELLIAVAVAIVGLMVVKRLVIGGKVAANVVVEMIRAGAQVVDVRSPEEFRDGFFPGAINIPVNELGQRAGELKKDKGVVLYCASGARSGMGARILKQAGFTQVVNAGGLSDMPR